MKDKKDGSTLNELEILENRLYLKRLKFERAMDEFDIDGANIACAQAEYIERQIKALNCK